MIQAEIENPEVAELVRVLCRARRKAFREVVKRAVARGELAATVDSNLLLDLIMGPVHGRMRLASRCPRRSCNRWSTSSSPAFNAVVWTRRG